MDSTVVRTNAKDQIWFRQDGDVVKVGFTASFLQKMDECWHILPASRGEVLECSPLMAVETNDSLLSIRSPVTGRIMEFNPKALNFPDKLVSSDIIFQLNTNKKAVVKQAIDVEARPHEGDEEPIRVGARVRDNIQQWWAAPAVAVDAEEPAIGGIMAAPRWERELVAMAEQQQRIRQHQEQVMNGLVRTREHDVRVVPGGFGPRDVAIPPPQPIPPWGAAPRAARAPIAPNPPGNPVPPRNPRPTTRTGRIV